MAKEIYHIPYSENISVMPDGYAVIAMDNSFDHHKVAWFSDKEMAEEFAKYLCNEYGNRPDECEKYSDWAREFFNK